MTTAPSGDSADASDSSSSPASPPARLSTRLALRVLVVDDWVDAAESLALLLRKLGYHVRTAHDGFAALQAAADFQPEAILLDLAMPKLNGFHVAKQLRERDDKQLACLIAISGYGQAADVQSAKNAGFDHHLIKPVCVQVVDSVLQALPAPLIRAKPVIRRNSGSSSNHAKNGRRLAVASLQVTPASGSLAVKLVSSPSTVLP